MIPGLRRREGPIPRPEKREETLATATDNEVEAKEDGSNDEALDPEKCCASGRGVRRNGARPDRQG